jgi:nitrogen fixation/metabolism regulation signal transduction histidine kinase
LSRELVGRIRRDADRVLLELPPHPPSPEEEEAIRQLLTREGVNYVAFELPEGGTRVVATGELPAQVGLPTRRDWETLGIGEEPKLLQGASLRFFGVVPNRDWSGRCVGVLVSPETARAIASAPEDDERKGELQLSREIQRKTTWLLCALILLAASGAAFLLAGRTARRIRRPVEELAKAANRVASGDLAYRARIEAEGELGELVSAFNRMTAALSRSKKQHRPRREKP